MNLEAPLGAGTTADRKERSDFDGLDGDALTLGTINKGCPRSDLTRAALLCQAPGNGPGYFFATELGSSIFRTWPGFTLRWMTFTPLGKFTTTS